MVGVVASDPRSPRPGVGPETVRWRPYARATALGRQATARFLRPARLRGASRHTRTQTGRYRYYNGGLKWFGRRQPDPPPAGVTYGTEPPSEHVTPAGFRWTAIRDAAESVASERGVPAGDIRAVTHVIEVEGLWSYLIAPGCGICSTDVAASPDAAARYLREVFGSIVA